MFKKTKEKINQNEYVIFIKKMWANKRYRSLFVLALYFVFFFVIITGLKSTYQDNQNQTNGEGNNFNFETIKESYNNLKDYSYEIFVNDESLIVGKLENGINNFVYDDNKYTLINNNIYKEEAGDLKKVDLLEENMILSIIDKLLINNLINYVSEVEANKIIDDNSFRLDYEIPNSYFSFDKEGLVRVSILGETETSIGQITIDLSDYKEEEYKIKILVGDKNVSSVR